MKWFDAVVLAGLALILLPALLAGGWIVALFLALVWLLATVGGREGWDLMKQRQSGATAAKHRSRGRRLTSKNDDSKRWER